MFAEQAYTWKRFPPYAQQLIRFEFQHLRFFLLLLLLFLLLLVLVLACFFPCFSSPYTAHVLSSSQMSGRRSFSMTSHSSSSDPPSLDDVELSSKNYGITIHYCRFIFFFVRVCMQVISSVLLLLLPLFWCQMRILLYFSFRVNEDALFNF